MRWSVRMLTHGGSVREPEEPSPVPVPVRNRDRQGADRRSTLTRRSFLSALPAVAYAQAAPARNKVVLGGDVMLSRNVAARARAKKDPAWPFRDIAPVFAEADIAFVNLESPFSDKGAVMQRGMIFKTEPDMIAGLEHAGIDVVSTANNHARDRGSYGLEFTVDHLAAHGIAAVGTGKTIEAAHAGAVLQRNGVNFGFLAYTYDGNNGNYPDVDLRIALLDIESMRADVTAMKARADVILVSMHAGIEYATSANKQQAEFARAAIDAGARVVMGHHPHVRQPWEWYGGGAIFYSLGNLIFDQFQRTETQIGSIAELVFEGTQIVQARTRTVNIVLTVPRLEPEPTAASAGK
jgi:poly-gamma-glutamate capsule biosynthesis protein CapA/YwtB (metallophosphatase superfamily)